MTDSDTSGGSQQSQHKKLIVFFDSKIDLKYIELDGCIWFVIEGIQFPTFLWHLEIFKYNTMLKWEDECQSKMFEGVNVILECSGQGL